MSEKGKALVIGASGFLGSHVVKQLSAEAYDVRGMFRKSSDKQAVRGLAIERFYGDVLDKQSMKAAMQGVDFVFHCALDPRAWLRDSAALYRTNVDGLRNSMEAALECGIKRFVFTSTFATIASFPDRKATEADEFNWWDKAPEYVRSRVLAENMFFDYCNARGLPGIAMNVGNTYGSDDFGMTGHGGLVDKVVSGKMKRYFDGGNVSVGIKDAARAMVLACENGRIGERYIITERYLTYKELMSLSADFAGVEPPTKCLPRWVMYLVAGICDLLNRLDVPAGNTSIRSTRLVWCMGDMDNTKARTELNWEPHPVEKELREAVEFYQARQRLALPTNS